MHYVEARIGGKAFRWPVRRGTYLVGRNEICDIVLPHASISNRHLELTVDGNSAAFRDLGSTNGCRLDGILVPEGSMACDQWLSVGSVLLTLREAVSLTSSLGVSNVRPHPAEPAFVAAPATESGQASLDCTQPNAKSNWTRQLIARLERPGVDDDFLDRLLDFLCSAHDARTAALVARLGNGWAVRSMIGLPWPDTVDLSLVNADTTAPSELHAGEQVSLAYPLRDGAADAAWIVLYPWPPGVAPDESFQTAALLASWWLSRQEKHPSACPDDSSTDRNIPDEPLPSAKSAYIAVSPVSRQLLRTLDRLARSNVPLLLEGESGTGKELLARRAHRASPRKSGPFVGLNCSNVPRDLIEAEFFGIEAGVATGVNARPGHFSIASGGTLFLDEIGELPGELQPKLLRALELGEIQPLGASRPLPVDVRIIAATNRPLAARVREGSFREDLFYRLAGAVVQVPPLRERPEDILPMARAFAKVAAVAQGKKASALDLEAARCLCSFHWPGNVRELRHAIARAVALADGPVLSADLFADKTDKPGETQWALLDPSPNADFRTARSRFESLYFSELLQRCNGNVSEAARLAGLSRTFLYQKLVEHGLQASK